MLNEQGAGATVTVADHHAEHIISLSNDPQLAEENARRTGTPAACRAEAQGHRADLTR